MAALALEPDHARLHAGAGAAFVEALGEAERGVAMLERAVELDPDDYWIRRRFGFALYDLGDIQRSIEHFRVALEIDPRSDWNHASLAFALLERGDVDEAVAQFREALRIDPRDEEVREGLIDALIEAGDVDGASAELELVRQMNPRLIYYRWNEAHLRAATGDRAGAKAALDVAVERTNPNGIDSLSILAEYLAEFPMVDLRDPTRAEAAARRTLEVAPRYARGWAALGVALYRGGDWNGCIDAMERAMKYAAGGMAHHWLYLAMAHQQLGRHLRAEELVQQAADWLDRQGSRNARLRALLEEARAMITTSSR
jgi:tetratricopeptide (TPR) repeat protein